MKSPKEYQDRLNFLGYDCGPADGAFGKRSVAALKRFQAEIPGLVADGVPGPKTESFLFDSTAPRVSAVVDRDSPPAAPIIGDNSKKRWPTQSDVERFFGPPASARATAGKCRLPFPFRLDWDLGSTVSSFSCHEAVADAFTGIFRDAAAHYGEDRFRALGFDRFGGCYNPRRMRGGSAWSMHAWGIAVDLNADANSLNMNGNQASFARKDCAPFWEIVESYGMTSLGRARDFDWMHFQAARLG